MSTVADLHSRFLDDGSTRVHKTEELWKLYAQFAGLTDSEGEILRRYCEHIIRFSKDEAFVCAAQDILDTLTSEEIDFSRKYFRVFDVVSYTASPDKLHNVFSEAIIESVLEPWKRDGQPLSS
jgi:hypothetical protein